jgi:hypothetical protein
VRPEVGDEHRDRPATERAEELADRMGQRLGYVTTLVGLRIRKTAARAREEAEDMWAEAQGIRGSDEAGADATALPQNGDRDAQGIRASLRRLLGD